MITIPLEQYGRLRCIEATVKRLIMWPMLIGTQEWCELKEIVEESGQPDVIDRTPRKEENNGLCIAA